MVRVLRVLPKRAWCQVYQSPGNPLCLLPSQQGCAVTPSHVRPLTLHVTFSRGRVTSLAAASQVLSSSVSWELSLHRAFASGRGLLVGGSRPYVRPPELCRKCCASFFTGEHARQGTWLKSACIPQERLHSRLHLSSPPSLQGPSDWKLHIGTLPPGLGSRGCLLPVWSALLGPGGCHSHHQRSRWHRDRHFG